MAREAMTDELRSVRLVMLGPPGVGKGTQSERFARERRIPKISTGDILREAVQAGTPLGRAVKSVMDAGRLVSDDLVIDIVRERLERRDATHGFVLDGFPRSLAQLEALDRLVDDLVIIDIEVPEDVLIDRLRDRRICGNCGWNATPGVTECARCGGPLVQRSDDNIAVVRERLKIYNRDTQPILEHYRGRSAFRIVDGNQTQDAVAADIAAAVASVVGRMPA